MARKKLRVGFDFDGVLAYNPIRIFRLPVSLFTRFFLGKESLSYLSYYPKSRLERFFWKSLHWASFFPASGFGELKKLLEKGEIEGYIISGRFALLEAPLKKWLKKHGAEGLFAGCYLNKKNEPIYLFKERMIKKLRLDVYVEDNWDIVNYLNFRLGNSSSKFKVFDSEAQTRGVQSSKLKNKKPATSYQQPATSIHWIYNILDRGKIYKNKHPHLRRFLASQGWTLRAYLRA